MERKINKYLVSIPVTDWIEAKSLATETNWRILEVLRDSGINGLSTKEISEEIKVPIPSVYSILSKLEATGWIESTMKRLSWGRPSKEDKKRFGGKPTKIFIENVPWGDSAFDEEFVETLKPLVEGMEKNVNDIRDKWLSILDNIISAYQTDDLKKFFPQEAIHEKCGRSHEGVNFLYAISLLLLLQILNGKDFEKLARKYKFVK